MIFWIGFIVMVLNEGFVIMRHVSPWFARRREALIARFGSGFRKFHSTLDWVWLSLVTLGIVIGPTRNVYILALAIWWGGVLSLVYIPKWLAKRYK